jgi:signal transduction histidine kinase
MDGSGAVDPRLGDLVGGTAADRAGWLRRGLLTAGRGLLAAVVSFVGSVVLLVVTVVSLGLLPVGVGIFLVPPVLLSVRWLAQNQRRVARDWFGVEIPVPYRPRRWPAPFGVSGAWQECRWLLSDPATWRDVLWLATAPVNLAWGLLPASAVVHGVESMLLVPALVPVVGNAWYVVGLVVPGPAWLMVPATVVQGALLALCGLAFGPWLLERWARANRLLLRPTRAAALAHRVEHLARTRTEATDAQAAELRRIERDLHDGAQARLAALGMSLGMAEDVVLRDPEAALRLLTEARQASDQALSELRDLVHGIHPPVLAERGLAGAVRALALDLPIPVDVDIEPPGGPPEPVETAVYFAVAESLANVTKHSGAGHASVRLRHADGKLRLTIADDGRGGADVRAGTGLRGIERRLSAHDGTLVVASPPGGPTVLTMEVPCEWSSRRTTRSSGTD